jgi:hypothetical protein
MSPLTPVVILKDVVDALTNPLVGVAPDAIDRLLERIVVPFFLSVAVPDAPVGAVAELIRNVSFVNVHVTDVVPSSAYGNGIPVFSSVDATGVDAGQMVRDFDRLR